MAHRSFSVLLLSRDGSKDCARYAALFLLVSAMVVATCGIATAETLGSEARLQSVALDNVSDLTIKGGQAEPIQYQGRQAIRLTTAPKQDEVLAFLKGAQIQDGTIECDVALKITTPPGVRMPGFVGVAFRASPDGSHYELFYLRPGNARSEDQAMRNHSVQYVSIPGFDWYKLRREWPWLYESYAVLEPEHWSHMKIDVHGRLAKLLLDGSENASLVVNGLKGQDLRGGVALWGYAGEEAYFANLKVTPAEPVPLTNDGEVAGNWDLKYASDYGRYEGSMNLHRNANVVIGTWSGAFAENQPIHGTWRNGYVELTFNGSWPGDKALVTATLVGWIDGDAASGRMKVEGRADGQWTAQRRK
ncbi:MAG: hypothetical protein JO356_11420 [Acidobacteria bacterium]|nr:hypothetical protein [Acidobacteriota bacterium]